MLKIQRPLLYCCAAALVATAARGDGIAISVDNVANKVTISGGVADTAGFAPRMFVDGSDDAQLIHENVPGFGDVASTDVPAIVLNGGIALHSFINFEFLPRPVRGSNPVDERVLWHWNASSQSVALAPNGESLTLVSPFGEASMLPQQPPGPQFLFMTHLEPEYIGEHRHFMTYLLDDSPTAAIGAYGFFARFLIAPYQESDPFLIVLNNGLDAATLLTAAQAINAVAGESVGVDGDFNSDGKVDAADYVLWRKGNVPTTPQNYGMWRSNFGQTAATSGAAAVLAAVPEPGMRVLTAAGILALLCYRRAGSELTRKRRIPSLRRRASIGAARLF